MEAYLDNSATTSCLPEAAAKMEELLTKEYGNPSSLHLKGMEAEGEVTKARKIIAKTLKCQEKEICFTSGGTESNNMALIGAAYANRRKGKHIITTSVEHDSVSKPLAFLEEQGYEITRLPVDSFGRISTDRLKDALRPDTILVSIMHVNNEVGAVMPVGEAGSIIKAYDPSIVYHVDAIQSYGKLRIIPKQIGCDLLSVSGHKIHGPKGSGFLYIKDKTKISPIIFGGGQQKGMRSGTENVPAIAGLAIAAEAVCSEPDANADRLYRLREHFTEGLEAIDGITVNGHSGRETAPHIVSVSVMGVRAEVLLHALEEKKVYVSAGSACSSNRPHVSQTLTGMGIRHELLDSTVRFSFSVHTTMEEIDYALSVMQEVVPKLSRYRRH